MKQGCAISKLFLGLMLGASTAAVMAESTEAKNAYEMGKAAVEEHRYALALQHFQRAAQQGHGEAQNIAGMMLYYGPRLFGSEIQADRFQARRWLQLAAEQGSEASRAMLVRMESSRP